MVHSLGMLAAMIANVSASRRLVHGKGIVQGRIRLADGVMIRLRGTGTQASGPDPYACCSSELKQRGDRTNKDYYEI